MFLFQVFLCVTGHEYCNPAENFNFKACRILYYYHDILRYLCVASVCVVMCAVRGSTCHCQCWVEVEGRMVEAPHHRHQRPHIRDWSLPISSLQSPQSQLCPLSAQLTATLSFIISAHSLHGPGPSTEHHQPPL